MIKRISTLWYKAIHIGTADDIYLLQNDRPLSNIEVFSKLTTLIDGENLQGFDSKKPITVTFVAIEEKDNNGNTLTTDCFKIEKLKENDYALIKLQVSHLVNQVKQIRERGEEIPSVLII